MWRSPDIAARCSPLEQALADAQQVEVHARTIDASRDAVWRALTTLTADDLPSARALMRLRHGGRRGLDLGPLLTSGPVPAQVLDPPRYAVGVKAHRPWSGRVGPAIDLDDVRVGHGWVVTGTEFRLEEIGSGRTLLTTQTRCSSANARTRWAMRAYWTLIARFSGLIRRELLTAVARRAQGSAA